MVMLTSAWLVSLELTKQRIELEAQNKINAVNSGYSPFVWSFEYFKNDVVESFHSYWLHNEQHSSINAPSESHPQLSLNFSGQSLNTLLHDKLVIYSSSALNGTVKLQMKVNLGDGVFYYNQPLALSGKINEINLNQNWQGLNAEGKPVNSLIWNKNLLKHR